MRRQRGDYVLRMSCSWHTLSKAFARTGKIDLGQSQLGMGIGSKLYIFRKHRRRCLMKIIGTPFKSVHLDVIFPIEAAAAQISPLREQ
jgi:hypothetical protein